MSESTIDEKLNKYAKESKIIEYTTKLFENTSEEREEPKLIIRQLIDDNEKNMWTIILKYKTLENVPQEVIMGTLDNTDQRKEKAIEIMTLIIKQLKENAVLDSGYKYYEELSEYVAKENIPFKLTMEGTDILSIKTSHKQAITRTYVENKLGKIECLFAEEDLEEMKSERRNKLIEYIKQKKEMEKWQERREKILNAIEEKEKQKFIKGEKVTEFLKEKDEDINEQQRLVADYLIEAFEDEKSETNPKYALAKGYLNIKEKGITKDIKIKLEKVEETYFKSIKDRKGEISLEEYKNIERIEDYKNFLDLVKNGKDWNARLFALRLKKINFTTLKNLVKAVDNKDDELIQYIDKKEAMINELQTDSIDVDYENDRVKEMYQFLLHSSIREKTKAEDKRIMTGVYQHIKREIIESNIDAVELYNNYAEKSNIYVCEIPKVKKITEERPISKVVKKICTELDRKENEEIEQQNNKENPGDTGR